MPEIAWYRSLYWRIALGFVALLAVLLAVQGVVFLWLTGRAAELLPGRSPAEYAQTIALDTALVLREQPQTDLDEHLNGRYRTTYRPFVVVTRDGRLVSSRRITPPFELSRATLMRLRGWRPRARSFRRPRRRRPSGAAPTPGRGADQSATGGSGQTPGASAADSFGRWPRTWRPRARGLRPRSCGAWPTRRRICAGGRRWRHRRDGRRDD